MKLTWISNHTPSNVCVEITHLIPKLFAKFQKKMSQNLTLETIFEILQQRPLVYFFGFFLQLFDICKITPNTTPNMLRSVLVMSFMYTVVNGSNIYTPSEVSSVAATISLQCHHGLIVRSRLELSKACSSAASCRAIRTDEWGTSSMWCACPKQIMWPRTWNYELSTIRQRRLSEQFPGNDKLGNYSWSISNSQLNTHLHVSILWFYAILVVSNNTRYYKWYW